MEGKSKRPEWMYSTPPGSVDSEAEEKAIQEEEAEAERARKAVQAQPPSLDQVGPTSQISSKDLTKANPIGPSTHAGHVARGMEEAEARLDRGPRRD
jgi:hypothetical protein